MNVSQIIKAVMLSAAEAELGALFINCKLAVPARKTLEEIGHLQPKTPMKTDNSTSNGLLNNTIIPKATKSIDMQFHWMRCRDAQRQFRYYWRPGTHNWGDYWTKHHPEIHHRVFRKNILTLLKHIEAFRRVTEKVISMMTRVCYTWDSTILERPSVSRRPDRPLQKYRQSSTKLSWLTDRKSRVTGLTEYEYRYSLGMCVEIRDTHDIGWRAQ